MIIKISIDILILYFYGADLFNNWLDKREENLQINWENSLVGHFHNSFKAIGFALEKGSLNHHLPQALIMSKDQYEFSPNANVVKGPHAPDSSIVISL